MPDTALPVARRRATWTDWSVLGRKMPAAPFPVERLHANDDDDDDDDRPAFIQRALLPDESSSEDDDDDAASPPVLNIACAACSTHLTRRGMQVFLVADNSSLFSTDIPSDDIREGGNHPIETCQCQASSVHCRGCDAIVGYHVTTVCGLCGDAEHNGHFWLFTEQHVSHSERGLTWDARVGRYVDLAASSGGTVLEKPPVWADYKDNPDKNAYLTDKKAWFARNVAGVVYSEHEYRKAQKRALRDPETDNDARKQRDSYGKSSKASKQSDAGATYH